MGMAFRTYQVRRGNWGGGGQMTPVIKALLIANGAVFLFQTILALFWPPAYGSFMKEFGLVPTLVVKGLRLWQPFTYLFLHGGLLHILLNMLVLWMFGTDVERSWGRKRFLNYYLLTGAGAGLVNVIVKIAMDLTGPGPVAGGRLQSDTITIGASGAIYGVLVAAAVLFPDRQVWLIPFPISMQMRVYVFIMGLIAFFGTIGSGGDNVSHICHLSGMIIGYLYLRRSSFLYGLRNRFYDWKRARARRKFDVYVRDHKQEPPSRPDKYVN